MNANPANPLRILCSERWNCGFYDNYEEAKKANFKICVKCCCNVKIPFRCPVCGEVVEYLRVSGLRLGRIRFQSKEAEP